MMEAWHSKQEEGSKNREERVYTKHSLGYELEAADGLEMTTE